MAAFIAERVVKSDTMNLCASTGVVFPLLCPIREYEWIEPWSCDMVFSASSVAENNAVFRTDFPTQGGRETWIVCRYEKDQAIGFIRVVTRFQGQLVGCGLDRGGRRYDRLLGAYLHQAEPSWKPMDQVSDRRCISIRKSGERKNAQPLFDNRRYVEMGRPWS